MKKQKLLSIIADSNFLHPLEKEEYSLAISGEIPISETFKTEFKEFLELEYSYWNEYQEALEELKEQKTQELIEEEKRVYPEKKKLIEEYYFYLQKYLDDFTKEMETIGKNYEQEVDSLVKKEEMSEIEKIREGLKQ